MVLERTVLEEIAAKMTGFDALIIPEIGYGSGFLSDCKDLEKRCYIGDPIMESARVFSRDAFEAIGGYDPSLLLAEDWDIHDRLKEGRRMGRTTSMVMHNTVISR